MSNNKCVKTGANVWLHEYGAMVHGDLYEVGEVYVLGYKGCDWQYGETRVTADLTIDFVGLALKSCEVLIAHKDDCRSLTLW